MQSIAVSVNGLVRQQPDLAARFNTRTIIQCPYPRIKLSSHLTGIAMGASAYLPAQTQGFGNIRRKHPLY
ncbi:MAG TPA: hypothetical protein DCO71_04200 [Gammaproteobacteria bacterium]|nr:hypothetical protein [Gammaproteobacteria bacterium]